MKHKNAILFHPLFDISDKSDKIGNGPIYIATFIAIVILLKANPTSLCIVC